MQHLSGAPPAATNRNKHADKTEPAPLIPLPLQNALLHNDDKVEGLLVYPRISRKSDFSSVIGLTRRALSIDK
eukprot:4080611-Pleurochrysis_carterae.AAC.4